MNITESDAMRLTFYHFLILVTLILASAALIQAQDEPSSPGINAIRAMLIGKNSWQVEYLADPSFLGGAYVDNSQERLKFWQHGASITVSVTYRYRGTCESPVEVVPDGFKYEGCLFGEANSFKFYSDDREYPFRSGDGPWAKHLKPAKR